MIQKEIAELRRRYRADRNGISRIYGAYVNANKEIISRIDASLGLMGEEEQEMYLSLLKKCLSGTVGKNLIDIEFSTAQVADSEEHRFLMDLRKATGEDSSLREELFAKIIESLSLPKVNNYLILFAVDAYDVPFKGGDEEKQADASDQMFRYFICAVCPVKDSVQSLRFFDDENVFHSAPSGNIVLPPAVGFMFPAFDHRTTNLYNSLYYTKDAGDNHGELIDALFKVTPPMSATAQKDTFGLALSETLSEDCSFDVVSSVQSELRARVEISREAKEPAPPSMTIEEAGDLLVESGVSEEKADAFRKVCQKQYGEGAVLHPKNLVESKFEVNTPEVKVSVKPAFANLIETRIIDGRRFLLIPADDGVEINGISVTIPKDENTENKEEQH